MTKTEAAAKAFKSDAPIPPGTASTGGDQRETAPSLHEPNGAEQLGLDGATPALCSAVVTAGEMIKLGGVDAYVSKPAGYPTSPARLLLLLTSGPGIHSSNNQLQADHFASEGYLVVMPDLFNGDPAPRGANPIREEEILGDSYRPVSSANTPAPPSLLDTFKIKAAEAAKSFLMDMWLARHTSEKVLPILRRVIGGCRDEFADAVSTGGGIYAVGYCFGARYVLLLAAERPLQPAGGGGILPWMSGTQATSGDGEASGPKTEGPLIKAGALAHPTLVSKNDFTGLKAPVSVVAVEDDPVFPDEIRSAGEDYMTKNGVEHEVQVYPGMPHGFAIVGEYDDETTKVAQATAHRQILKWLQDH